jgi:hypothetical protein
MRRRPSVVVRGSAAATSIVLLGSLAGCEAKGYGSPVSRPDSPNLTVVVPHSPSDDARAAPANQLTPFDGLAPRAQQAVSDAAAKGADIAVVVLDRDTNQQVAAGQSGGLATASVAKLFIADDLLTRQPDLSPADRKKLDVMLRSSDDDVAEEFWNRNGGNAIVTRVAGRYGLTATMPPSNGRWWNTISSPQDLVRYYDMLLDGTGGLPVSKANIIVNDLAQSTATGIDGYPQRFGIPDGLFDEPVAVKQGWMCCIGPDWMHLSTGVIGSGRRYVMVIYSLQPSNDAVARTTITQAVKTMFPSGRI